MDPISRCIEAVHGSKAAKSGDDVQLSSNEIVRDCLEALVITEVQQKSNLDLNFTLIFVGKSLQFERHRISKSAYTGRFCGAQTQKSHGLLTSYCTPSPKTSKLHDLLIPHGNIIAEITEIHLKQCVS